MASPLIAVAGVLGMAAVILSMLRMFRGPTATDRAVALDVVTLVLMPAMVGIAVFTGRAIYIDVALVYGLLSFLGVMSLARYLDRGL